MQLTRHTDYSLRLLIYLQAFPGAVVSVREVADAYDISIHHLAKVAQQLTQLGWIESQRGRGGGVTLSPDTPTLSLGEVVRALEPSFAMAECLGPRSSCPIEPACRLKKILRQATEAFLAHLGEYTLADLARRPRQLAQLLSS